jgi:hypothetical protein
MRKIVMGLVVFLSILSMVKMIPDMVRYLKIRSM